jgi:AraC-like DNA-binding protein
LIEKNIRFELVSGACTQVHHPHATGWRILPTAVLAQVTYAAIIEREKVPPERIEPGETFALGPGISHNITMVDAEWGISHWCQFLCDVFHGVSLFHLIGPPLRLVGARSRKIRSIIRALVRAAAEPSLDSLLQKQLHGWELVTTLLEAQPLREDRIDFIRNVSRLSPVLAYIEQNLTGTITHQAMARHAGLSPSRFHLLFRSALDCAPYEYVQKLRLKKAQQLLTQSDLSIAQIAEQVGYPDPYHFSRIFRRQVDISPLHYRQQRARSSF